MENHLIIIYSRSKLALLELSTNIYLFDEFNDQKDALSALASTALVIHKASIVVDFKTQDIYIQKIIDNQVVNIMKFGDNNFIFQNEMFIYIKKDHLNVLIKRNRFQSFYPSINNLNDEIRNN
jgi:hypothetical protein